MSFPYICRTVALILCLIFNIPLLGLIAHWTSGSLVDHATVPFEPMGLFTVVVTLLVLPTMLILPQIRKNAFVLYIASELAIIGLLWILWVVVAALAIDHKEEIYPLDNCSGLAFDQIHWCSELFAIVGLSVVVFVILMIYMLFIGIYATVVTFRTGSHIWFQTVKDMEITMPAMTHNAGDLESKARRDESYTSVPLNAYPAPGATISSSQLLSTNSLPQQSQQPYYAQSSYPQPQLGISQAAPPNQGQAFNGPSQVAMQITPARPPAGNRIVV